MATYNLGDVVMLDATVLDADGNNPADATAVTVTVTAPDGAAVSLPASRVGLGSYTAAYTPATSGRYLVRWVATGANASAWVDDFVVRPVTGTLTSRDDLEIYLHRTISSADQASADAACGFADAAVIDTLGFDPVAGAYDLTASEVTLLRGIAVRIAAQWFTNPEDRSSYSGPEGLSYSASPDMLSKVLSEADRRTLIGVQLRYAPGFA